MEKEPNDNEKEEEKGDEKEDGVPAVAKKRKVRPKFDANLLNDPKIGLEKLMRLFDKFDEVNPLEGKEGLAIMMRYYQQWLYHIFPADFGDMCWKIDQFPGTKKICRNFVDDKKGYDRFVGNDDFQGNETEPRDEEDTTEIVPPENHMVQQVAIPTPLPQEKAEDSQVGPEVDIEADILDLLDD
ncbi:hypothetical protein GPJ56_010295 [Histomonas meleagridis]|uniref:uncharacterized protein n=1 Tax=Histomonas meleagridis TaxID=135588 RepID=UPI003559E565|nr:hypothetical protein GPJ56_010295 [Histomonas meleagridis]KAH0797902.1 hypothetical protein GO595_009531 [Histomonas meleagridis]